MHSWPTWGNLPPDCKLSEGALKRFRGPWRCWFSIGPSSCAVFLVLGLTLANGGCTSSGKQVSRLEEPTPVEEVPSPHEEASVVRIRFDCVSGIRPHSLGERPLIGRLFELDGARVRRILRFSTPPTHVRLDELDAAALAELRSLAGAALKGGPQPAELPVPDGTRCRVEIEGGGESLSLDLTSPTRNAALAPLLAALLAELPAVERPETERDAAITVLDGDCRQMAAGLGVAVEGFALVEMRVDSERWRYLYYLRQRSEDDQELSTDDHFACRADPTGALLWQPEG